MSKAESCRRSRGESDVSFSDNPSPVQKMKKKKKPKDRPDENFLDKLMKKADSLVETFQYDLAKEFYKRVIECDSNNLTAMERMVTLHLQLRENSCAKKYLLQALQLEPDRGYRKHFSLGQVNFGKDSLAYYIKGIEVWTADGELPGTSPFAPSRDSVAERKSDLSSVYCAMAELYLTDLCDEDDAESQCLAYIQKAMEADETDPESYQCLASFHLVKGEKEEAKACMEKSLQLWFPRYKQSREEGGDYCPLSSIARTEASKNLIEVEMFDEASDILDGLLEEDDQDIEVWYLLGLGNVLRGSEYSGNARYYLQKGLKICKKYHLEEEYYSQVKQMNEMLSELGPESDNEDENINENDAMDDGDDEEYETVSEEEDT